MPEQPKDLAPATAVKPAYTITKQSTATGGGAPPRQRVGVSHRIPEGRVRGGAAVGSVTHSRVRPERILLNLAAPCILTTVA